MAGATREPSAGALEATAGLTIVDLAGGLPGGLFARFFLDAGARVIRCEGADPFASRYPAWSRWYDGAETVTRSQLAEALAAADVCFIGGEAHPDLPAQPDAGSLSRQYPSLVVVDLGGLEPARESDLPAVEVLVQAAMGFTAEHLSEQQVYAALAPGLYGGTLLALLGTWVALIDRLQNDRGQIVRTSLEQGIALIWTQLWMAPDEPDTAFDVVAPLDVQHLIFPCADGEFLQFTYGIPGSVRRVYEILGLETDATETDPGGPRIDRGSRNYFGYYDELATAIATFKRADLLARLRAAGIPAEPVLAPAGCWDDPQAAASGIIRTAADGSQFVGPAITHLPGPRGSGRAKPLPVGGRPLEGLRILDFGTLVAGPYASTLLGNFGAETIKVEPAQTRPSGATVRNLLAVNFGKRRFCVDAKSERGAEVLRRLCASADVIQHNFRVGVSERLGLDPASMWAVDPHLTTLTTTAFGPRGPKAYDSGLDMVVAALTGHQRRFGGEEPMWFRAPVLDFFCGALGAVGILMSRFETMVSGSAPAVETSLYGVGLFLLQDVIIDSADEVRDAAKVDARRLGVADGERLYQTADGWIAVAARSDPHKEALADALDADVIPGTPLNTAAGIERALSAMTTSDAVAKLAEHGVWATAGCQDGWGRLASAPGIGKGSLIASVTDPKYGTVRGCFGDLVSLSHFPADPGYRASMAPRGADTRDILGSLGYTGEEVDQLYSEGVVA
jgi:crotonobetainyl-CoA:carnitine CoA-transferase CaiB-like acyl-CoA transferase